MLTFVEHLLCAALGAENPQTTGFDPYPSLLLFTSIFTCLTAVPGRTVPGISSPLKGTARADEWKLQEGTFLRSERKNVLVI